MPFLDLNLNLTEEDVALKNAAHKFASEVMRPIAKELDEMTPMDMIAEASPLWEYLRKAYELGYHRMGIPAEYGGLGLSPIQSCLVFEELAWASFGLAVQIGVAPMPFTFACALQAEDLIQEFVTPFVECTDGSIRGCWAITEPDHGSDTLMPGYPSFRDPAVKAQCRARLDGDEWVINGQKAAWVSGAPIATHTVLFCQTDPSMGHAGGGIALVPLDRPGVSKGKPLNKLGQRDMPQGEIFFEDVRIPASYMLIREEAYEATLDGWLAGTTAGMGIAGTGLARAAFEEALTYAKERVQGGKRLIEHPTVQTKLFRMFEKVEAMRQMSRAASIYNSTSATPAIEYGIAAKLNGTEGCFEVASDAVQIFGGNGLAKEYLVEKLFRDARATLIEDGSNDILAIAGGHKVIETYPRM